MDGSNKKVAVTNYLSLFMPRTAIISIFTQGFTFLERLGIIALVQ